MRRVLVLLLILAAVAAGATTAGAQTPQVPTSSRPDFLFGRPDGSLALRGGWVLPHDTDLLA